MKSEIDSLIEIIRKETAPFDPIPTELRSSVRPLTGIRHISFDVYGTLIASGVGDIGNSAPADRGSALAQILKTENLGESFEAKNLEKLFLEEVVSSQEESRAAGAIQPEVEIREVWKSFLKRVGIKEELPDAFISQIALQFELLVNPVWPMPGLLNLLESLSPRFAPFSIVSNAQFFTPLLFPALTGKTISELGFDESSCIWSYQLREAKPSPRLFECLIEKLATRFQPSEILYVGNDKLNDISAAKKAGLRTALFAGDQRSLRLRENHPDCLAVEPDLVITKLSDLPALLTSR